MERGNKNGDLRGIEKEKDEGEFRSIFNESRSVVSRRGKNKIFGDLSVKEVGVLKKMVMEKK